MSTLDQVRELVAKQEVYVSDHGYDELANDGIFVQDILAGVFQCSCYRGLSDLLQRTLCVGSQRDGQAAPIHVVWGIPKNTASPAVIVTAYRPDPNRWLDGYTRRK